MKRTIQEKIKQRRAQMLIHSYIYYFMGSSIVSDEKWQKWANELVVLQKRCKSIGFYDDAFSDWDGNTGMHLPRDEWVIGNAISLMRYTNKKAP